MKAFYDRRAGPPKAFSLVELLVAMTILSIMALLVSQTIIWVTRGWSQGRQLADDLGKGRAAIDLITRDLEMGIFRADLGAFTTSSGSSSTPGGNYSFYVGRLGGSTSNRPLTLVNYYVDSNYILERQVQIVTPSASPTASNISFGSTAIPQMSTLTAGTNASELVTGVVAFQMYFLNTAADGTPATTTLTFQSNTRAIGVALMVVDEKTGNLLTSQGKYTSLVSAIGATPSNLSNGIGASWRQTLDNFLQTSASGYPTTVRTGIRIFESVVLLQSGSAP